MKIGSFVALTLAAILLGLSEGSNVDFFHILDQTTAEFLLDGSNHFGRSSSAAILKPRNNKYLEASMQIIRGKKCTFVARQCSVQVKNYRCFDSVGARRLETDYTLFFFKNV